MSWIRIERTELWPGHTLVRIRVPLWLWWLGYQWFFLFNSVFTRADRRTEYIGELLADRELDP